MRSQSSSPSVRPETVVITGAIGFTCLLLASFLPIPHASVLAAHTWRAELLAGIFLLGALVVQTRSAIEPCVDATIAKRVGLMVAAFVVWSMVSLLWADSRSSVWHHTLIWCEYLLFFLGSARMLRVRGLGPLLAAFSIVVGISGFVCAIDYLTLSDFGSLEGVLRARYSAYGELLITAMPLLWAASLYSRTKSRWRLSLLPAGIGWITAMLSLSKGVFIAGVIGSGMMFALALIFGKHTFRRRTLATAAVWVVLTIAVQAGFSLLSPVPATVDYISGKVDATRETSIARIFMWRVTADMVRQNWLIGVGADNYGAAFNTARAHYRQTHPDDPADEPISDFLVERAHNEPLQIFAELGAVGLALFMAPLILFGWLVIRTLADGGRLSPIFCAAFGGMTAFAASSMVSSFSFRIAQNGVTFFVVFAVAVHELAKARRCTERSPWWNLFPVAMTLLAAIILTLGLKAAAEWSVASGDRAPDGTQAIQLYRRAASLDPDYSAAYYRLSRRTYEAGDYQGAAAELRRAIDRGMGVVLTYSQLADCFEKAGDNTQAAATYDEALRIFPRSVFLRVRYSIFLMKISRSDAADAQAVSAREIDRRQANGWHSLMTKGSLASYLAARDGGDLDPPAELRPESAVHQFLDKDPSDGSK